jgi:uncharacterized protein (TIGR02145 family)
MLAACKKNEENPHPEDGLDRVTIDGVTWSTRNVATAGAFVGAASDAGGYFTFEDAQTACPDGWRAPATEEFEGLVEAGGTWETLNGVAGRRFGTTPNSIFLPASGYRNATGGATDQGRGGYYWSSVPNGGSFGLFLSFGAEEITPDNSGQSSDRFSVRCVAE